jgi:hypothetical protein
MYVEDDDDIIIDKNNLYFMNDYYDDYDNNEKYIIDIGSTDMEIGVNNTNIYGNNNNNNSLDKNNYFFNKIFYTNSGKLQVTDLNEAPYRDTDYNLNRYKFFLQNNYDISNYDMSNYDDTDISDETNKINCYSNYNENDEYFDSNFKKLSFNEVEKSILKYYKPDNYFSNELDILMTYLRGQKNMFMQSKNLTERTLNLLIIPSIIFSTTLTIISPLMYLFTFGWAIVSALNGIIMFLISLIKYFKLESKVETFSNLTNQYEKLETTIELTNNKLFFMKDDEELNIIILEKIKEVENKLIDMKEYNSIFIPELIKYMFPVISHINIFSFIKKIEMYKKNMIISFTDVKNEIRYIIYLWKCKNINILLDNYKNNDDFIRDKKRLFYLLKEKERMKEELIQYKNAYIYIDEIFTREIKNAESWKNWWFVFFHCKQLKCNYNYSNPVINEYLNIIFSED